MTAPSTTVHTPESAAAARLYGLGKGTTTLLMGAPGAGKTFSLLTLAEAGLETAVIGTDPGFEESLLDAQDKRKFEGHIHTRYIAPVAASWAILQDAFSKINQMSYESLSSLKAGIGKEGYRQMLDFLSTCSNFKCESCGKVLGPVDSWDATRALAVDSASGLNMMTMHMMIGAKPTAHQGEYGVAMNAEEQLVYKLVADTSCFFVLTCHMDRVHDEIAGNVKIMPAFLGNKLAPKIPRIFSDVVLAYKEGDKFYWSTAAASVDLKNRALPLRDKLEPSFKQIVEVWKRRQEQLRKQVEAEEQRRKQAAISAAPPSGAATQVSKVS